MKKLVCLGLSLVLAPFAHPAWADDDLMSSQLADQARHWQQKDRDDIAADLWRKLLRADPKHPEALVKLGAIEARAGNVKEAEALYSRASHLATPPAGLKELSDALKVAKGVPKNLRLSPTKQERPKLIVETAKTNRAKRVATKSLSPSAIDALPALTPGLPTSAKKMISAEEGSKSAEMSGIELKFSTSIDLVNVKNRP